MWKQGDQMVFVVVCCSLKLYLIIYHIVFDSWKCQWVHASIKQMKILKTSKGNQKDRKCHGQKGTKKKQTDKQWSIKYYTEFPIFFPRSYIMILI